MNGQTHIQGDGVFDIWSASGHVGPPTTIYSPSSHGQFPSSQTPAFSANSHPHFHTGQLPAAAPPYSTHTTNQATSSTSMAQVDHAHLQKLAQAYRPEVMVSEFCFDLAISQLLTLAPETMILMICLFLRDNS